MSSRSCPIIELFLSKFALSKSVSSDSSFKILAYCNNSIRRIFSLGHSQSERWTNVFSPRNTSPYGKIWRLDGWSSHQRWKKWAKFFVFSTGSVFRRTSWWRNSISLRRTNANNFKNKAEEKSSMVDFERSDMFGSSAATSPPSLPIGNNWQSLSLTSRKRRRRCLFMSRSTWICRCRSSLWTSLDCRRVNEDSRTNHIEWSARLVQAIDTWTSCEECDRRSGTAIERPFDSSADRELDEKRTRERRRIDPLPTEDASMKDEKFRSTTIKHFVSWVERDEHDVIDQSKKFLFTSILPVSSSSSSWTCRTISFVVCEHRHEPRQVQSSSFRMTDETKHERWNHPSVDLIVLPREPKHHQTWCFLCEKHQKNGISYDGTDKNIDVFWFHQWKGNISSISLHDFDFLLKSWMILMKFSLFIDEIQKTSMFLSVSSFKFHFFHVSAPWVVRSAIRGSSSSALRRQLGIRIMPCSLTNQIDSAHDHGYSYGGVHETHDYGSHGDFY